MMEWCPHCQSLIEAREYTCRHPAVEFAYGQFVESEEGEWVDVTITECLKCGLTIWGVVSKPYDT